MEGRAIPFLNEQLLENENRIMREAILIALHEMGDSASASLKTLEEFQVKCKNAHLLTQINQLLENLKT